MIIIFYVQLYPDKAVIIDMAQALGHQMRLDNYCLLVTWNNLP
jgi:hypothetical protein